MPSPLVHSFAGAALAPAAATRQARITVIGALIVAANAADFDFIPGLLVGDSGRYHHGPAHSLVAAAVVGLIGAWIGRRIQLPSPGRFGVVMALAFATHLALDMMSIGKEVRHGVPAFYDIRELIRGRPMEAALVVTPIESHHAISVYLSSHGIHNLTETSWCSMVAQAKEMIAAIDPLDREGVLASAGESGVYIGDIAQVAVQLERTAWVASFDILPLVSMETKKRVVERVSSFGTNLLLVRPSRG